MKLPESLFKVTPFSKALAMVLFVALPFIGYYFGTRQSTYETLEPKVFSSSQEILEFEGLLEDYDESCIVDAQCTAIVDGKRIITDPGHSPDRDSVGKYDVNKSDIGARVKVKALKIKDKELSIVGDKSYYVLKL